MMRYLRETKPSRLNKKKYYRSRFGHSRGQHQNQKQQTRHNGGCSTRMDQGNNKSESGHHGGVPPPPAASSVPSPVYPTTATAPPITLAATQTRASQEPCAPETDRPAEVRHLRPSALLVKHKTRAVMSQDYRVPGSSSALRRAASPAASPAVIHQENRTAHRADAATQS